MNKFLTPPTSGALSCERRQPGLLGAGQQTFVGASAMNFYMRPPNPSIAGQYATDEYTAALLLISQLSSPDEQMSPEEAESMAVMLKELLQNLEQAKDVSAEALQSLQKAAAGIPVLGPLMFSPGNIPGTLASGSGVVMAAAKAKKVSDMLNLTSAQHKKLRKWANQRGGPNASTASKVLRGRIKILRIGGKLFLDIPLTLEAKDYKVLGEIGKSSVKIPIDEVRNKLNKRVHLHAEGARGSLKVMNGTIVGVALAVGPQAYLDWTSSSSKEEFYRKSAESQPTNVAAFAVGAVLTFGLGLAGAPLVAVIAVGWGAGLLTQHAMARYGVDKMAESAIKERLP
ncbi:hypothetical protein GIB57_23430 [Pseudomonas tremae]|nr:Uncharacterized protein ALO38_04219 [Pseudomonas coronafaciens pv. zizaniae]MCF5747391.1 hypothetical protein [Pseudomonas tremae]UQB37021.1 hypothetical protein I9H09_00965 [Pseudomonas tremae]